MREEVLRLLSGMGQCVHVSVSAAGGRKTCLPDDRSVGRKEGSEHAQPHSVCKRHLASHSRFTKPAVSRPAIREGETSSSESRGKPDLVITHRNPGSISILDLAVTMDLDQAYSDKLREYADRARELPSSPSLLICSGCLPPQLTPLPFLVLADAFVHLKRDRSQPLSLCVLGSVC